MWPSCAAAANSKTLSLSLFNLGRSSLLFDMQNRPNTDGQQPTPNISSILVATNSSFSRDKLGCTPTQKIGS
jgi:hypothetical protein